MNGMNSDFRAELERIRRVSDMLCSGHATLATRAARRAFLLDLSIVALAAWLVALAFVGPALNISLTPWKLDPQLWTGLLSLAALLLAVVQLQVDWKGQSDAHRRSCDIYGDVHREIGYLLAKNEPLTEANCRPILARYDFATDIGAAIPEAAFLVLKRKHLTKIAISRHLDKHPSTWIPLVRVKFWVRDNLSRTELKAND